MKKILLTGGSGFIGRNLYEKLVDKYQIFVPLHKELDLLDLYAVTKYIHENQIDIIIHSAIHIKEINGINNEFYNDMLMFLNIEKQSSYVEKILYFGSGAEYDKRYHIQMVKEEQIGNTIPENEYGLAKYTMNMIARESRNIYNLRLFGIYGKYELWDRKFISNLCCKSVFNLPLTIRRDCYFDFLYIEDLPAIVDWFCNHIPKYHDYNVCYGSQYLLTIFAEKIKKVSKKDLEIKLIDDNECNLTYSADNTRLKKEIPQITITPYEEAIKELYQYYNNNKNLIDYTILERSK